MPRFSGGHNAGQSFSLISNPVASFFQRICRHFLKIIDSIVFENVLVDWCHAIYFAGFESEVSACSRPRGCGSRSRKVGCCVSAFSIYSKRVYSAAADRGRRGTRAPADRFPIWSCGGTLSDPDFSLCFFGIAGPLAA